MEPVADATMMMIMVTVVMMMMMVMMIYSSIYTLLYSSFCIVAVNI